MSIAEYIVTNVHKSNMERYNILLEQIYAAGMADQINEILNIISTPNKAYIERVEKNNI